MNQNIMFPVTIAIALFATMFILLSGTSNVHANPESFMYSATSSPSTNDVVATSSVTWQTAGKATTTVILNGGLGTNFALKNVALVLYRLGAASTNTKTKIDFEFSKNCAATAPDWYGNATTSAGTLVTTGTSGLTWQFASSTIGGATAASDYDTITIQLGNVPMNCVRAVLTTPVGAASSSIWGMLVGKKEVQ